MFLAESAQAEVKTYVNTNQGQSYSVTTTTVNGVTTTETKSYNPDEPIVVNATASAKSEVVGTTPKENPTFTLIVTPAHISNNLPPTTNNQSFLNLLISRIFSLLFRRQT